MLTRCWYHRVSLLTMSMKLLIPFTAMVLTLTVLYQLSSVKKTTSYLAYYDEPCGRSLLVLKSDDGKSIAVQAIGNSPIFQLRHIILVNAKLNVTGYFTGKHIDDQHCGNYPEFYVTQFSSAGPVTRCSSVADWVMYEQVVLYPPNLPDNKLINIDFNKYGGLIFGRILFEVNSRQNTRRNCDKCR